ncbi:Phosphoserine phosphatase RsbU [Salinivirga cyanobacteriivorans]|uniref:Phosphoserine phosphatase RsbU n=1 Tax=Salinivirga cyanobacteriivorans TaxID=1307839 RepID=A0A0S2I3N3_9BACT|nr:SpoIIE family protein phosphatase [Salinivirga cyanobacteriivorans]ALO16850.1 Phosphoserine phosphatase RsbU [Salinivirga cyanobacteriivorans]
MTKLKNLLIAGCLILCGLQTTKASETVELWLLEDSMHIYQPDDIFRQFPSRFTPLETFNLNFGLSTNEYWLVVDIKNSSEKEYNGRLVVDYGLLKNITLFEIKGVSAYKIKQTPSSHAYIYNIAAAPHSKRQFLLHVKGEGTPAILPIKIDQINNILQNELKHTFQLGPFYGILLFLFLIILLVNLSSRDRFFRLLFIYTLLVLIFFGLRDGFAMRLSIIENYDLQFRLVLIMLPLLIPMLEQFLHKYFRDLTVSFPRKNSTKALHLTSALLILIVTSGLLPYKILFYISAAYVIISILIIVKPVLKLQNFSKITVLSILGSMGLLLAAFIIDIFHKTGVVPNNFLTLNALKLGFLLHIGIFILGAIERFQLLRARASEFNQKLSDLVKEKTAEINQQNEELTTQTEQLELQKEELESQKEELQTQKEILESQNTELEKLNLAASNTENVIYIFNPDGKLLWFNESFSSQLGMSFKAYQQSNKQIDIRDISSYPEIRAVVDRIANKRESITYETPVSLNNQETWFQTTLTPIIEEGSLKYIVAIDTDISRLKNYEKKIIDQQEDFEKQKDLAVKRRKEVELQQREITDSLNYAQRIQSAILPKEKSMTRFFPESFVLFIPRDIVSGDFYWFHRIEDKYIYVVVDCTGHGVPGAFMSIIGTYLLNNIIIQNNETRPAEILKQLNRKLKISLKNTDPDNQTNDGMDVALVVVDKAKDTLSFAGALRPLFLFQDGKFIQQKGDKIPITSAIAGNTMANFNEYTYEINKGDSFYLFSDGIVDQFGGSRNKKFLTKRLKQVIFDSQMYEMDEQKKIIQKSIIHWKGNTAQIDDILLLGVRL